MPRILRAFSVFFVLFATAICFSANGQGSKIIYRITLDDDIINPVSAEYITGAIAKAEADRAVCLIIELDTPGGLLSSTRGIVKRMMNADVPIVVYVSPKGARAGSAGVFITLAAHVAAMAPSTNIGAAHPVDINEKRTTSDSFEDLLKNMFSKKGEDKKGKKEKEPALPMEQKILNDTKAWAAAIAKERNRNVAWAEKAVTESVSVPESEALALHIVDIAAKDETELIAKLDGHKAAIRSGERVIGTKDAVVADIPKNFRLRWLAALAHPNIAYILMMLGIYGLLFEFTHPGIAFPGIAGAICLILAFFGLQVLPTNYAGVVLIAFAILMFIAEIKVVSYGLLTVGGVIALFFGSLILFSSPYDFMRVSMPIILAFTLSTMAIAGLLTFVVVRSRRQRVTTGLEGLVGEIGEVRSWNGAKGRIFVHGELWDASSSEAMTKGDKIEVVKFVDMELVVKKNVNREP